MYFLDPSHRLLASLLEFQKTTLNNTFSTMIMFQKQTEDLITRFMDQVPEMSQEGRNILYDWFNLCDRAREQYVETISNGYQGTSGLS